MESGIWVKSIHPNRKRVTSFKLQPPGIRQLQPSIFVSALDRYVIPEPKLEEWPTESGRFNVDDQLVSTILLLVGNDRCRDLPHMDQIGYKRPLGNWRSGPFSRS